MSRSRRRHGRAAASTAGAALLSLLALAAVQPAGAAPAAEGTPRASTTVSTATAAPRVAVSSEYAERFLEMYDEIHDPANGYFSPQGIPYHSVETLIVEAPDHGHETTSEAYSFWLWLEAAYGRATADWTSFNDAWATMETYMIPQHEDQPTNSFYNPQSPATYAAEYDHPSKYPAALNSGVRSGVDPLANELKATYGTSDVYGMHWLADVDNTYGFGAAPGAGCLLGPDSEGTSYINTFQRGAQESVWETVPQPSCEDFSFGGTNGFLDLFTGDSSYAKQWKYTNASDADARAVEAAYWAHTWATEQGQPEAVAATVAKAAKMGDYLRYAMFDKYFKQPGCTSPSCPAGTGKNSAHYLMSWYYAWGGALDPAAGWAWRIGSSHAHFGYQNPMAAWALSTSPALEPQSPTAVDDWSTSLERQLEFYQWLQSDEGGIAGGATNSWGGAYGTPPAGTPTFYGMAYQEAPVYSDPPSNQWFGMQVWSMERVAQLYYESGDAQAKALLDRWVPWAIANTQATGGADWAVPSTLRWTGAPDAWDAANPGDNSGLHVEVISHGQDVGVAAALAGTLIHYAAAAHDDEAQAVAKSLLDSIWEHNRDDKGVSAVEVREDYKRFDDVLTTTTGDGVYVPSGWQGTMPNGDEIEPGVSFLDLRSFYRDDPDWPKVQAYLDGGEAPAFRYHRFWAQSAVAVALANYDRFFGEPAGEDTTAPTVPTALAVASTTSSSATLTWTSSTDDVRVTGYDVLRDGVVVGTATGTIFTDPGLAPATAYAYTVRARDAAGNLSAPSSPVTATTRPPTADTTPPSVPAGLRAGTVTTTSVPLTWDASSDAVGVTGYDVYQGTVKVATVAGTSHTVTGLAPATGYSFSVAGRDAAGNVSARSTAVSATTAPVPTGACTAAYRTTGSWSGGFQGEVTVTAGNAPVTGWTVRWDLAPAAVSQLWGASHTVSGTVVTASNLSWNGSLAAGGSTSFGFIGTGTPPTSASVTCAAP
ncbi:glycoside hydrolase family 48 protein [Oerskovia enterophila]|uniref:Exoglucanase B n=1 Tax=Oerskovia enterophila TaxID=43678 RepID=A0ABX2Y1L0_9CELL|nr:glycoside hydrolase family 48 protein [Oerskovia enterophila]OCI30203.1 exoglucanase B precursor [Oerskovia enterophila]